MTFFLLLLLFMVFDVADQPLFGINKFQQTK